MYTCERPVRFEDVDAAQLVFFANYFDYCHEAMEGLLSPQQGGYTELIMDRKIGLAMESVEAEFHSPLRFGQHVRITASVDKIDKSSCTFRYVFTCLDRKSKHAEPTETEPVGVIRHGVNFIDLRTMSPVEIPKDVLLVLESHAVPGSKTAP